MKTKTLLVIVLLASALTAYAAEVRHEYVVHEGDTLGDIMFVLRREGVDINRLHDWNPDLSMRTIKPGQTIVYYTSTASAPPVSNDQAAADVKSALQTMNNANARLAKTERNFWIVTILITLTAGSLVLYGVFVRRNREVQRTADNSQGHEKADGKFVFVNGHLQIPDHSRELQFIEDYAKETNNLNTHVPFWMLLPRENRKIKVIAIVKNGKVLRVYGTLPSGDTVYSRPKDRWSRLSVLPSTDQPVIETTTTIQ